MKIKIYARDLQNMLKTAKGLELRKLDRDVQKSLLIKGNQLIMNNVYTQLESEFDIDVIELGETLIPEPTLKMLEHFKSDSLIITDDTITHGTKELKFMPGPMENFIKLDDEILEELFTVKESELNHLLEVNYSTTNDETRPILRGIEIKSNKFAALNGYYLSLRQGKFNCEKQIILSQEVWKVLLKTLDKKSDNPVTVYWNGSDLVKFKFKNFTVKGKLYEGKFLRYEEMFTKEPETEFNIDGDKFYDSLKLMDKLTRDKQIVLLFIEDDKLKLKTKTDLNIMTDEIPISSKEGPDVKIAFNIKYLLRVVNEYKKETPKVQLTSSLNPMIFRGENKLDLVLPVRLPEDYGW